jgi:hypothetical protein
VDRVQVRSGALLADLSAHEGKIDAARSEGVIMAMSDPSDLVVARLDGMLVAYELIDAQARLGTCTAPAMIPAGTLPNPTVLRMLVDERMGLPAGEASLAGYERMMAAWSDLGVSPAPAPIRDPDAEDRVREILQTHPELERFVSPDLIRSSPEERAERVRDLVAENPGLERFVPQDLIRSSPEERTERVRELVAENPGLERFVPPDLIRSSPEEVLIRALSGEGPVDDPFTPPRAGGPDLNP